MAAVCARGEGGWHGGTLPPSDGGRAWYSSDYVAGICVPPGAVKWHTAPSGGVKVGATMSGLAFRRNDRPTIGVEIELQLVDAETLAFQATMPGLAEELVYRGILPALLLGLVRHKPMEDGIPWAVVLATSVIR